MKYRLLGHTGLRVSEIALGCEGMMKDNCRMAGRLLDLAEEAGINYFDLYASNPDLHKALGEAMEGRREKFMLQGHIGSTWQNGQYKRSRDLAENQQAFETMLKNLRTDYVDVGMIHYVDDLRDWEGIVNGPIMAYACRLKQEGRIRHVGLSSHNPQVAQAAAESGLVEVIMFSVNPCYDLLPAHEDVEQLWNRG